MRSPCQKFVLLSAMLLIAACKGWRPEIFVQRTPRERYADALRNAAAARTPGRAYWLRDADSALRHPAPVALPYRESGRIVPGANAAAVFQFRVAEGERVQVTLRGPAAPAFIEIYRLENGTPRRLAAPDSGTGIAFDAEQGGLYLLLLQHTLQTGADYSLRIAVSPSLAYPAVNPKKNRIGSVWGDARDAGARRHEGVDIFAPKGSPALAAAPGRIARLTNGGLGGKTVWLRPDGRPYSLYYAHLDSQWVVEGQVVRTGDTLGQIGNTGNARFTAAHLHFGVYGSGGAVDPAPFIRQQDTTTAAPVIAEHLIGENKTLREPATLRNGPGKERDAIRRLPAGTSVRIVAASRDVLRVRCADTLTGWIPYSRSLFRQ